jgi:phosphatidylinositol 4-kinase
LPCIVKGGDDLRQELVAMQLIRRFQDIFSEASLSLTLRPYEIIVTSNNSGIIEFIPDSISIDALKKTYPNKTLRVIYEEIFGEHFEEAQKSFIESLAAYSILTYLLNIKDRHNGNILIDAHGRIIHIDFGFILSISPGGLNFESYPFKLTRVISPFIFLHWSRSTLT